MLEVAEPIVPDFKYLSTGSLANENGSFKKLLILKMKLAFP